MGVLLSNGEEGKEEGGGAAGSYAPKRSIHGTTLLTSVERLGSARLGLTRLGSA